MMAESCVGGQGGSWEPPLLWGSATRQAAHELWWVSAQTPVRPCPPRGFGGGACRRRGSGRGELSASSRLGSDCSLKDWKAGFAN